MKQLVTTYHLEMLDRAELRPASAPALALEVHPVAPPSPELARFFYSAVGGDYFWIDRLGWSYGRWQAHLGRPEVEMWIGTHAGVPVGYFELERQPEDAVEITYFGLLPQWIGRGLGGALLTAAIERAWAGARRVWVHTCSLDGPAALANYQARGFRQFREETEAVDLPDSPPGPWPGARSSSQ
ncbi:MAG TPA: GNAT family N-acetyltransferase [Herpetosiphonaceae bacterium]|nr:GNAT family N-acetyltransferase [Herpetosiphonaceae bacterium]